MTAVDSCDLRVGCRVRVRDGVGVVCGTFGAAEQRRLVVRLSCGGIRRPLVSSVVPYRRRQRERV